MKIKGVNEEAEDEGFDGAEVEFKFLKAYQRIQRVFKKNTFHYAQHSFSKNIRPIIGILIQIKAGLDFRRL